MSRRRSYFVSTSCILALLSLTGCGAPDIGAMHPQVHKPVVSCIVVGNPSFATTNPLSGIANTGAVSTDILKTNASNFLQQSKRDIHINNVNYCVVLVDNVQTIQSQLQSVIQDYANVQFVILSNFAPPGIQARNLSIVSPNSAAQAFAIGWLAGYWAQNPARANQIQPSFDFLLRQHSTTQDKAFLTGLFTEDPNASVAAISLPTVSTQTNSTSKLTTPFLPSSGAVVTHAGLSAPVVSAIQNQIGGQPITFSTDYQANSGLAPAIQPGVLDPTHVTAVFEQILSGKWKSGNSTVIDPSSVRFDTSKISKSTLQAWSQLEPTLSQTPNLWQADYQKLPAPIVQKLNSAFGIA